MWCSLNRAGIPKEPMQARLWGNLAYVAAPQHSRIAMFTADTSCGRAGSIFVPLENFSAQTKSCGAACPNWARRKRRRWPARLRIHIAQREDVAMKHSDFTPSPQPFELDLDDLLHPAQAFAHPRDVVTDGDLTVNEKRAVLASWASDACAVERAPALRRAPGAAGACRLTRSWRPSAHSTSKRTMPPAGPCGLGARRGAGHSRRSGSVVVLPARKAGFRATIPT